MSTVSEDAVHAIAAILGLVSVCGGTWLAVSLGAALMVFGGLVLSAVVYSRCRRA